MKSTQPVPEPFLDLLIQVDSAKGRNYREYTVLLDPPETPIIQQEKIVAVDKTGPPLMNDKKDTKESIEKNKAAIEKEVKISPKSLEKINHLIFLQNQLQLNLQILFTKLPVKIKYQALQLSRW